jgi:hypothetical protein
MRRLLVSSVIAFGILGSGPAVRTADACPMCKLANEEGSGTGDCEQAAVQQARPKAYMYSILFMLSMPATLLGAFSAGFYRLHRRHQAQLAQEANSEAADPQA